MLVLPSGPIDCKSNLAMLSWIMLSMCPARQWHNVHFPLHCSKHLIISWFPCLPRISVEPHWTGSNLVPGPAVLSPLDRLGQILANCLWLLYLFTDLIRIRCFANRSVNRPVYSYESRIYASSSSSHPTRTRGAPITASTSLDDICWLNPQSWMVNIISTATINDTNDCPNIPWYSTCRHNNWPKFLYNL